MGRHFTLQPMACTNHKFPVYGGRGIQKEVKLTVSEGGKVECLVGVLGGEI